MFTTQRPQSRRAALTLPLVAFSCPVRILPKHQKPKPMTETITKMDTRMAVVSAAHPSTSRRKSFFVDISGRYIGCLGRIKTTIRGSLCIVVGPLRGQEQVTVLPSFLFLLLFFFQDVWFTFKYRSFPQDIVWEWIWLKDGPAPLFVTTTHGNHHPEHSKTARQQLFSADQRLLDSGPQQTGKVCKQRHK